MRFAEMWAFNCFPFCNSGNLYCFMPHGIRIRRYNLPLVQVLTLEPGAPTRQSERTSGFTSPSRFSSPTSPMSHTSHTVPRAYSEDEGSRTASMTLQATGSSVQEPRPNSRKLEASAAMDDPVVLSL